MEEYTHEDIAIALAHAINGAYASVSRIKSPIKRIKQLRSRLESLRDTGVPVKLSAMVLPAKACRTAPTAPRRTGHRQRSEGSRSSAASGDGNSSDDSDPERRQPLQLYDQSALAAFLCISKKTLQNRYSVAPHTLPQAIAIPGARGPRWTAAAVQQWLSERPRHTAKPVAIAPRRKAGRPRIALASKVGVQS